MMKESMNICVVCGGYPYPGFPQFTFVEQFCKAAAFLGNTIYVIAPQSIINKLVHHRPLIPFYRYEKVGAGEIHIYTPKIVSFGKFPIIGKIFNSILFKNAVSRTFHRIQSKSRIDVCYAHFWSSAISIFSQVKHKQIPLFVASGESVIKFNESISVNRLNEMANYVSGVICASSKNMQESIEKCFVSKDKCQVFPNGIDQKVFFFKNKKAEIRKNLGFLPSDFIVIFVGAFIDRKGSSRLSQAIDELENVKAIFIGKTTGNKDMEPNCKGILFRGTLDHNKIPDYLNCADVFALPTLAEGCCNAIVEAMACGLPIISSDRDFNYDILDNTNAILVDPMNIDEIKNAIKYLKDNVNERIQMSRSSLVKAQNLKIENRVVNILSFIKEKMNRHIQNTEVK